jgi:ribose/xylose/arabinose/galactoside ABC-type transport system permease subunit
MNLSAGSEFVSRFRSGLFVIVLSFFFMAFALTWKAIASEPRIVDVLAFVAELGFGALGLLFVYRFASDPQRMKLPIVSLLVVSAAFHLWLILAYVDFRACPFGATFCTATLYGYLAILVAMAAVLAAAKPTNSSIVRH